MQLNGRKCGSNLVGCYCSQIKVGCEFATNEWRYRDVIRVVIRFRRQGGAGQKRGQYRVTAVVKRSIPNHLPSLQYSAQIILCLEPLHYFLRQGHFHTQVSGYPPKVHTIWGDADTTVSIILRILHISNSLIHWFSFFFTSISRA